MTDERSGNAIFDWLQNRTLFLTVQHPGSGCSIDSPSRHWSDDGDSQPSSSLIVIRPVAAGGRFPI